MKLTQLKANQRDKGKVQPHNMTSQIGKTFQLKQNLRTETRKEIYLDY